MRKRGNWERWTEEGIVESYLLGKRFMRKIEGGEGEGGLLNSRSRRLRKEKRDLSLQIAKQARGITEFANYLT